MRLVEPPAVSKVITFEREPTGAENALLEALEHVRKGEATNFYLIYTLPPSNESDAHVSKRYWFGESCFLVMGMLERAKQLIGQYIDGDLED